jgi:hypothetical protein
LKFTLALVFLSKKIKVDLEQELNIPAKKKSLARTIYLLYFQTLSTYKMVNIFFVPMLVEYDELFV